MQAKYNAQEKLDLVEARLKVRIAPLPSNAFHNCIHNEHLPAVGAIRPMFRWRAEAEFAFKPKLTAPR